MYRLLILLPLLGALLAPTVASADAMDVVLSRLRIAQTTGDGDVFRQDACSAFEATESSSLGTMQGFDGLYVAYNACWNRLMSQMGTALAGTTLSPARTPGPAGFYLGIDYALTGIDSDSYYWRRGTRGDDLTASLGEGENRFVPSTSQWMRLNMEKGLPFGFSLGGSAAYGVGTSYWALGASLQFAPFEGYRTGVGHIPDFAVRVGVMTLLSDPSFNLTVPTLDIILSKPITIGSSFELTWIVAGQLHWIIADSEVVDLTPERNALAECQPNPTYACNADPSLGPACRGSDVCHAESNTCRPSEGTFNCAGNIQDYNNNDVFESVRSIRGRIALGVQARYQQFAGRITFSYDIIAPETPRRAGSGGAGDPPTTAMSDQGWESLQRQWMLAVGAGFAY